MFEEAIAECFKSDDAKGVPCGLNGLHQNFKVWRKQALHIIAGRPGMGKSAFVKCLISDTVEYNFVKNLT